MKALSGGGRQNRPARDQSPRRIDQIVKNDFIGRTGTETTFQQDPHTELTHNQELCPQNIIITHHIEQKISADIFSKEQNMRGIMRENNLRKSVALNLTSFPLSTDKKTF